MIFLDTTVLSLAFRRSKVTSPVALELRRLILADAPLAIPGIAFQELLSGIREPVYFSKMLELIAGFPVVLARREDHVTAAEIANSCRKSGIATTAPDCLIAAQCVLHEGELFTTDEDFTRMARHSALRLFEPKSSPEVL